MNTFIQDGPDYLHRWLRCRICRRDISTHTGLSTDAQPSNGAFSVCAYCGEISVFVVDDTGVRLREATLEEIQWLNRDYPGLVAELIQLVNEREL